MSETNESQEPQAGNGVCIRCFLSAMDLERHDWEEHSIATEEGKARFSQAFRVASEDASRRAIETWGEAGSGQSACLVGIKG